MKYWLIFMFVITTLFGGLCIGSINAGRNYIYSSSVACYSGNSIRENCDNPYSARNF